jgi:hypothetical protein
MSKKLKRIIVVGAGIAGRGCERQFNHLFQELADSFQEEEAPDVLVLEGKKELGGGPTLDR